MEPIISLISKQLNELAAKPPRAIPFGTPAETFAGYPLEDILAGIPAHRKVEALTGIRKMAGRIGPLGGGGVLSSGSPLAPQAAGNKPPSPPNRFNYIDALCMRMRWANIHSTPFENVFLYVVPGKKIFIFIITKELKTVTLDVDDDALFPSDHLIAELRLLGG